MTCSTSDQESETGAHRLTVRRATAGEFRVVSRMLQLYLHDLSETDGEDLQASGCFLYPWLPDFWRKANHAAFVFREDGKYAGFALVDDDVVLPGGERSIEEFFVLRKFRRQGVGRRAATALFRALPGRWEVGHGMTNARADAFWREVIGSFTGNDFSEVTLGAGDGAFMRLFDNGFLATSLRYLRLAVPEASRAETRVVAPIHRISMP